jgi:hypothetical protein
MDFTDKGLWPLIYPQIGCIALILLAIVAAIFGVGLLVGYLLWG